eukprot:9189625-Alexandrium_andersonii.AAC.1
MAHAPVSGPCVSVRGQCSRRHSLLPALLGVIPHISSPRASRDARQAPMRRKSGERAIQHTPRLAGARPYEARRGA